IETDDAKKIVKQIKQMGTKVQSQIMDEKVRVTGKKIDDLQAVIAYLKEHGPEYPLQFVNFASWTSESKTCACSRGAGSRPGVSRSVRPMKGESREGRGVRPGDPTWD